VLDGLASTARSAALSRWTLSAKNDNSLSRRIAHTLIADTQVEKQTKQVLAKIVEAGEAGITHSEIMRKCQGLKGKVLKDIIQDLYEQHAIEMKDVPGRTKPTRWYYGVADWDREDA
jgi:hypothetical protein